MKKRYFTLVLTALLTLAGVGLALTPNPNPGVIPNKGPTYGELSAVFWQWAFSFPAADVPFFNTGGAVDISAHQAGHVWFLAGANNGLNEPRTGEIPAGTSLFLPLANVVNDYPCPAEFGFEPEPGETLEHFLQRTGNDALDGWFVPDPTTLFAEIDGVSLKNLSAYRVTSSLFQFTADPALAGFDPCITGSIQDGVSLGYWLLLPPLTPGTHTLHFGVVGVAPSYFNQDITYAVTVRSAPDR